MSSDNVLERNFVMSVIDSSNVFYYVSRFTSEEYVFEVPDSDRFLTLNAVADLVENKDIVYLCETEKVCYNNLGGDEENDFYMDDDTFDINKTFCFKTKNGSVLFYTNKLQSDGYNEEELETFFVSEKLEGIVSTKDLDLISSLQGNDFFQNCKIVNEKCINDLQSLISAEKNKEEYEGFIDKDSEPYGKQTVKNKETLSNMLNYLKFIGKQIKNTNKVSLIPKYDNKKSNSINLICR